ncbi:MAG: hypothetical protein NVSMB19_02000 [Vulcanimicrobiaceae bacterium]
MEIALLAGAAVLLFGGNKIRDVARGLGAAKKEFTLGQAEADVAHERARAEARAMAEANAAAPPAAGVTVGTPTIPAGPVGPQN